MNDYSQNSYRPYEYFSVSRGPTFSNGKHKILINEGAIRHFAGKAQKVNHGLAGLITPGGSDTTGYETLFLNRIDLGAKNETIIVPKQDYSESLLVGDGDKLYLTCSSNITIDSLRLPIVDESPALNEDYRNTGNMEIRVENFSDFVADYTVEQNYLESFESNETSATFNFLIAEFYKSGDKLIKKQRHSGIIFLQRVFRMKEPIG